MLNVGQTSSKRAIDALNKVFSFEGLPDTIVTDNGRQFVSNEFYKYCTKFNVKHLTSLTFHPASYGKRNVLCKLLI